MMTKMESLIWLFKELENESISDATKIETLKEYRDKGIISEDDAITIVINYNLRKYEDSKLGNEFKTAIIRDGDTREGDITAIVTFADADPQIIQDAIDKTKEIDGYNYLDLEDNIRELLGNNLISLEFVTRDSDCEFGGDEYGRYKNMHLLWKRS